MEGAKKGLLKILLNFVLPVALFFLLSYYNMLLGTLYILCFVMYKLYQNRAGVYSMMGKVTYSKGKISDALKWFKRSYDTGKAKPRVVVSYAYLLLKNGKLHDAEKILNEMLNSDINMEEKMFVKANLALAEWKKGNLDAAIEMLEDVCSNVKHTIAYGSLGYMKILKGDLDKALEFNLEAYEYNSTNNVIQDNLGQTYYMRGEYDKAEEVYVKLMAANPTFPEAFYNYGLLLMAKGETGKALESFQKALGYELSYLSTVTREEIEEKIKELKEKIG